MILNRLHASPFYTLQHVGHSSCCIHTLEKYRWIDRVRKRGICCPELQLLFTRKGYVFLIVDSVQFHSIPKRPNDKKYHPDVCKHAFVILCGSKKETEIESRWRADTVDVGDVIRKFLDKG